MSVAWPRWVTVSACQCACQTLLLERRINARKIEYGNAIDLSYPPRVPYCIGRSYMQQFDRLLVVLSTVIGMSGYPDIVCLLALIPSRFCQVLEAWHDNPAVESPGGT
eukprot:989856-Rhodomonas_salina.1